MHTTINNCMHYQIIPPVACRARHTQCVFGCPVCAAGVHLAQHIIAVKEAREWGYLLLCLLLLLLLLLLWCLLLAWGHPGVLRVRERERAGESDDDVH